MNTSSFFSWRWRESSPTKCQRKIWNSNKQSWVCSRIKKKNRKKRARKENAMQFSLAGSQPVRQFDGLLPSVQGTIKLGLFNARHSGKFMCWKLLPTGKSLRHPTGYRSHHKCGWSCFGNYLACCCCCCAALGSVSWVMRFKWLGVYNEWLGISWFLISSCL